MTIKRRPEIHTTPILMLLRSETGVFFHENAYLSVQISIKFRGTFSLLFKWKKASVRIYLLDDSA